jgi:hypothetical protein
MAAHGRCGHLSSLYARALTRSPQWQVADLVPIIIGGFEVRAQLRVVPIIGS